MDDPHDGSYAREPLIEDLTRICQALNDAGARYLLIGGFAVIVRGGARTTKDIDLLIDPSLARVEQGLRILEDKAIDEVTDDDIARYTVVRVADEVVVDLMARACGVDYSEAVRDVEILTIKGVSIPVAGLETLIRTKRTMRPSDAADRLYLEELLKAMRREP